MRICPTPHCGALIASGKYCPRCQSRRDLLRGNAQSRGYDALWHALSADWLRKFPICGQRIDGLRYPDHSYCVRRHLETRATVTDHIVSIRDGGARLDPNNFQSLCNACNVRKG